MQAIHIAYLNARHIAELALTGLLFVGVFLSHAR